MRGGRHNRKGARRTLRCRGERKVPSFNPHSFGDRTGPAAPRQRRQAATLDVPRTAAGLTFRVTENHFVTSATFGSQGVLKKPALGI